MLGLLVALLPLFDVPPGLSRLPAEYVGLATQPGACAGPIDRRDATIGSWLVPRKHEAVVRWIEPPRIGGCDVTPPPTQLRLLDLGTGRMESPAVGLYEEHEVFDLVARRCVTRAALRSYHSLALLGGALEGFALELHPGRGLVTARLIDARKAPATVHVLGKIGARTLEICDRTEMAEGHCPNPTHGEVRELMLYGDRLVVVLGLGLADVCGQDDLVIKVFPLPAALRRSLR